MNRDHHPDSALCASAAFDRGWPWAADHWRARWGADGPLAFARSADPAPRAVDLIAEPAAIRRLVLLRVDLTVDDLRAFPRLEEVVLLPASGEPEGMDAALEVRGILRHRHGDEGFWGQSVAEFGLALTLCGLRRIPQTHRDMIASHEPWDYSPPGGVGTPGARGAQFGDDPAFTHGTIAGKRVRVVGAGNIGARYASWCAMLGADVAVWDPFAPEPCFHRSGARREHHLEHLVADAEIFAPMLPLTPKTQGLIGAELMDALPRGCLVVQVTRAAICDTEVLYRRVLADELALAADVFDHEPVALDHPLLGRGNVVHTPHNAGRTADANRAWSDALIARFRPRVQGASSSAAPRALSPAAL